MTVARKPGWSRAGAADHDRSLDHDGMRGHEVDQRAAGEAFVGHAGLTVGGLLPPHHRARLQAELREHGIDLVGRRRRLQIVHNFRLDAPVPQQLQCVTGLGAARVVVNSHRHVVPPGASHGGGTLARASAGCPEAGPARPVRTRRRGGGGASDSALARGERPGARAGEHDWRRRRRCPGPREPGRDPRIAGAARTVPRRSEGRARGPAGDGGERGRGGRVCHARDLRRARRARRAHRPAGARDRRHPGRHRLAGGALGRVERARRLAGLLRQAARGDRRRDRCRRGRLFRAARAAPPVGAARETFPLAQAGAAALPHGAAARAQPGGGRRGLRRARRHRAGRCGAGDRARHRQRPPDRERGQGGGNPGAGALRAAAPPRPRSPTRTPPTARSGGGAW